MFVQRVRDYLNDLGIELHDRRQALAVAVVAALVILAGVCLY